MKSVGFCWPAIGGGDILGSIMEEIFEVGVLYCECCVTSSILCGRRRLCDF